MCQTLWRWRKDSRLGERPLTRQPSSWLAKTPTKAAAQGTPAFWPPVAPLLRGTTTPRNRRAAGASLSTLAALLQEFAATLTGFVETSGLRFRYGLVTFGAPRD
jgi:hypothetical protein